MDDQARIQLKLIADQAGAISDALGRAKAERLGVEDATRLGVNRLSEMARELLRGTPAADLLPALVRSVSGLGGASKSEVMVAAQRLAVAIRTFLAQEPDRLEELEAESQALQSKLSEAEARAINLVDDQLRDRCTDLLLRPGKADSAVREACVVLEDRIRRVAGLGQDSYGVDLVDQALGPKSGILAFSNIPAEQQGIHQLYRGVIGFFKNPTSHRLIEDYDLTRARQVVGLIDTLVCSLRDAEKRTTKPEQGSTGSENRAAGSTA